MKASSQVLILFFAAHEISSQPCHNSCSGHGKCNKFRQCQCVHGYMGADCSERSCPKGPAWADAVDEFSPINDGGHQMSECSNRGVCDRVTGFCSCERRLFEGAACERKACPSDCSEHGRCISMQQFASLKDLGVTPAGERFTYSAIWDHSMLYGCVCDPAYTGYDCSLRTCPTGDDPMTGTLLDPGGVQRSEQQQLYCRATGGTFKLTFKGHTTAAISSAATAMEIQAIFEVLISVSNENYVSVAVTSAHSAACSSSGNMLTIAFLQDFGDLPLVLGDSASLTATTGSVSLVVTKVITGSREELECSGRGICSPSSGVCACSMYFQSSNGNGNLGRRGDCGSASAIITSCPGSTSCSGHGACSGFPTYVCDCASGYTSADCSLRVCPRGKAWFDMPSGDETAHTSFVECSNMGTCDRRNGVCVCSEGFEGAACSVKSCPGFNECNGHGTCMTLDNLARAANINGASLGISYGAVPNNPMTWDFDMMQGCKCDFPYTGFDCSVLQCPLGDDPNNNRVQFNEIQEVSCVDDGVHGIGTFTITFRGAPTAPISVTATTADVESALKAISVFNYDLDVSVYSDIGIGRKTQSPVCSDTGEIFYIEFNYPNGDVPLVSIVSVGATFTVKEEEKGTTEWAVCSLHGLCNRMTGACECFDGYAASDGQGNEGPIPNCGYHSPYTTKRTKGN